MSTIYNLPGNGPWRVLDECPAVRHNTLGAARGRGMAHLCICPRALELRQKERQRTARWDAAQREAHGLPEVDGRGRGVATIPGWLKLGPWRVLEECPAPSHNTIFVARGGRYKSQPRCICPRALELLKRYRVDRSKTERAHRQLAKEAAQRPARTVDLKTGRPDWNLGSCRDDRDTADLGFNVAVSRWGIADRDQAKLLCDQCPIKPACGAWIMKAEGSEPGSYGGVWAGMDPWNRQGVELFMDGRRVRRRRYVPTS